MGNFTFRYHTLSVEGLKVTDQSSYPAFVLLLLAYMFTMITNIGLILLITMEKSLHQPMHILFCNLPLNDALGTTVVVPRILMNIFVDASDRYITYVECVIQAYFAHLFGASAHTVLMIMAFDRYVAICNPLRYATIMTNKMVVIMSASAWGVAIILVGILLGLTVRLSHCRSVIFHPFCDNASLFKLSCDSVFINNVYGLTFTALLLGSSMGSITITYLKIAAVCLTSKNNVLNSRALKTCATHLIVYVIMIVSGFVLIFLHRFPQYSDQRKLASIMWHVVPPGLNPVIYGLQTKEIRTKIVNIWHRTKAAVGQ